MISTNTTHPKTEDTEGKKLRVMTSNKITPKEYDFAPREFAGVEKRETRKVAPGMLTMDNLEERARIAKRAAAAEVKKALRAVHAAESQDRAAMARAVAAAEDRAWTEPEKKKAVRPRRQNGQNA